MAATPAVPAAAGVALPITVQRVGRNYGTECLDERTCQ